MTTSQVTEKIKSIIKDINQAWQENRLQDLRQHFHDHMVLVAPDFEVRFEGADACIGSYSDFIQQASVEHFQDSDLQVDLCGNTVIASYRFEIGYKLEDESHRDCGRDIFIFNRENDQWKAIWRTMVMRQEPTIEVTRMPS
jgi:ketosteroid isomerase-like protein